MALVEAGTGLSQEVVLTLQLCNLVLWGREGEGEGGFMNPQHGGRKGEEGARGSGAHLVLVAIVGLEKSFSKSVQLPEAGDHPHSLEVRGHITDNYMYITVLYSKIL